jgi:hypothetical protein
MSPRAIAPAPNLPAELAAEVARAKTAISRADTAGLIALEPLCDRLEQAGAHDMLAELATMALERASERGEDPSPRMPRFLLHAAEALGDPERLHDALGTAHRHRPRDPALALRWARSLEERGEHEAGLDVVARALAALLKEDDPQTLDGVLVTLLEAGDPHRLAVALPTLGTLLRRGETARILPFLNLAGENLVHPAARDAAWSERPASCRRRRPRRCAPRWSAWPPRAWARRRRTWSPPRASSPPRAPCPTRSRVSMTWPSAPPAPITSTTRGASAG